MQPWWLCLDSRHEGYGRVYGNIALVRELHKAMVDCIAFLCSLSIKTVQNELSFQGIRNLFYFESCVD